LDLTEKQLFYYDIRKIDTPKDGAELGKKFLNDADRE